MRYAPLVVLMLGWAHPSAQVLTSHPASLPRFEVASVKPSGKFRNSAPSTPTRLVLSQVTVRNLIQVAYRLPLPQIEGGAPWIDSERFDVEATTAVPTTTSEKDVLLQRLLADRFAFRMHFDTRPQPAYALVLSRADRRLGPNLTQSKFDCAAHRAAGGAPDLIPKRPDGLPICAAGIPPIRVVVDPITMVSGGPTGSFLHPLPCRI